MPRPITISYRASQNRPTPASDLAGRQSEGTRGAADIGSTSYLVEGRMNGGSCRITLVNASHLNVDDARKEARKLLAQMATGQDPRNGKKTIAITLGEDFAQYTVTRVPSIESVGDCEQQVKAG